MYGNVECKFAYEMYLDSVFDDACKNVNNMPQPGEEEVGPYNNIMK